MGAGYHGGFGNTKGAKKDIKKEIETEDELKSELKDKNVKFNENDLIFITRDKTGQIVWLEKGNSSAGLMHILDGKNGSPGHARDFERALGIKREDIGLYLKKVIKKGSVVRNRLINIGNGKWGYERCYEYKGNYYIMTGIGSNGFIVTAYPIRKDDL
ncbi:hypothetical protein [Sharpea porci]|uniref:hypothetical protein n=1 Tax=Sharpea porci TaxID=2652286 RepID=UPI00240A04BC|nr:hypothetical protein [Sharpea porci]MDD6711515.1 hypothetical protein [Sharpea porci]MDY5278468.1 hypothetical protein [Sharpea porci]